MAQVVKKQYVSKGGEWVEVPVGGGGGSTQVDAGNAAPTFTTDGVWADTTAPGPPPATVNEYVKKTGDTMSGPLVVPTPTLITQVGRWAEGVPRFATVAERDAAYVGIGGPLPGMNCYVAELHEQQRWDGTKWAWLATDGGSFYSASIPADMTGLPAGGTTLKFSSQSSANGLYTGISVDAATGEVIIPADGMYHFILRVGITTVAQTNQWAIGLGASPAASGMSHYGFMLSGQTDTFLANGIQCATYSLLYRGTSRYPGVIISDAGATVTKGYTSLSVYRIA